MMCGGTSDEKPRDDDTQAIVDQVKSEVESQLGKKLSTYELINYKTQVVAGRNYFAKVKIGDGEFVHLRIFQGLPHAGGQVELSGHQKDKCEQDPIEYF